MSQHKPQLTGLLGQCLHAIKKSRIPSQADPLTQYIHLIMGMLYLPPTYGHRSCKQSTLRFLDERHYVSAKYYLFSRDHKAVITIMNFIYALLYFPGWQ